MPNLVTWHGSEPELRDGRAHVVCGCDGCGWREWVDIHGLDYWQALERIHEVRDSHRHPEVSRTP